MTVMLSGSTRRETRIFLGCGAEEQNPYFGRREGGTSSNPHPKELNFVTVINIVKDCFCLGWIVK